jgi:pSer/pThr/pTyr-binding forkhead associated (FHA) protein
MTSAGFFPSHHPPSRRFSIAALPNTPPFIAVKLRLVSQDPLASPREIVLDHFPAEIGRSSDVALRIDDRWISRRHCRLSIEDGELVVEDLGSRHGTYVNGSAVSKSPLTNGSELCLGLSHFVVHLIADEALVPAGHDSGDLDAAIRGPRRNVALV